MQFIPLSSETSPQVLILPSKSSSSLALTTNTNTKAKRLLNTIDKLHQLQNANKNVMVERPSIENDHITTNEDANKIIEQQTLKPTQISNDNNLSLHNSIQTSESFIIDHKNLIQEQDSFRKNKHINRFSRIKKARIILRRHFSTIAFTT